MKFLKSFYLRNNLKKKNLHWYKNNFDVVSGSKS